MVSFVNSLFRTSFKKQKAEDKGRAGCYTGPGAMPGDGRTFFVSVGAKL
jgi:hypothetical protein